MIRTRHKSHVARDTAKEHSVCLYTTSGHSRIRGRIRIMGEIIERNHPKFYVMKTSLNLSFQVLMAIVDQLVVSFRVCTLYDRSVY